MSTVHVEEDKELCGLVGVAGHTTGKYEKAFKELLVVDSLRGPDSTGVAQVCTNGATDIVKHAMLPHDIFHWKPFKDVFLCQNNVLIGHNRWATQGGVNKVNAHPFELGNIIGVHNGTLRRQSLLPDYKDYVVDSENILHSINKLGVKDTWNKVEGAAALVWWNTESETLHFLRNKERPFHYCFTKDKKTMFWASEEWMLLSILHRNDIEHSELVETELHKEYVFEVPIHANIANKYPEWGLQYKVEHTPYVYIPPARKNNVTPLLGNKKVEGAPPVKKEEELRSGSEITFSVDSYSKGTGIKGWSSDGHNIEVIVHGGEGSTIHNAMLLKTGLFTGKVNSFYRKNDVTYRVIVQANSVKQKEEYLTKEEAEAQDIAKAFYINGSMCMLTETAFEHLFGGPCSWCRMAIPFQEGATYTEDGDAFCSSCTDEQAVQEYIDNEQYYPNFMH